MKRETKIFLIAIGLLVLGACIKLPLGERVECLRTTDDLRVKILSGTGDGTIALAYQLIPGELLYQYWKLRRKPTVEMLAQFAAFIVLCGFTHIANILRFWWPLEYAFAVLKHVTGLVSLSVWRTLRRERSTIMKLARANEELMISKEKAEMESTRMRDFLEAAPDAMLVVGPDGVIEMINGETERLFGYSRDDLIGMRIEELVPEGRRSRHEEYRRTYAAAPRVRTMGETNNIEGRRKDGTSFAADVKLSPFGASVIAAVRDVTARREADREREHLIDELMSTNAKLEAMGRTIVEMSTPVIPLSNNVLLLPIIGTFDSHRVQQVIEQAANTVNAKGSEVVIVDVTGVPVMDSGVVDAFVKLARVLALLGAEIVLTGIRPDVAQTMVQQGVAVEGFVTKATLEAGIREANAIAARRARAALPR